MSDTEVELKNPEAIEYRRQTSSIINGKGPFSIGYEYVNFRGKKLKSSQVERFSISKWSNAMPLACIAIFILSWLFLKTPFEIVNSFITGILGVNAFLVSVRFFRPGGLRLFILHRRNGEKNLAFVGAYTAETMIRMWDDILIIAPDMAGRDWQ